jgi:hypothetical protein
MSQGPRFAAGAPRRRRALEAALLLAAAVLFGEVCTLPLELAARARVAGAPPGWMLPLDDAYIFVRYAQQAARGRPWQWNTGEPSTGASSALWPWLLVPAHWLFDDLAGWSRWSRWMGVATLWALGLAAARTLRAARLAEPWPLAGGLCLVWSGPVGFGAVAGMESAGNAALLVLACAVWMESLGGAGSAAPAGPPRFRSLRSARVWAPIVISLLPLARPENGALALVAALAILFGGRRGGAGATAIGRSAGMGSSGESDGRLPWRRWTGLAVLLPGALLAVCNRLATGAFEPAGAVVKSWVYLPFLPLGARVAHYLAVLRRGLLPVYLGAKPTALWPPVGLLAMATAVASLAAVAARWRRRRAPARAEGGAWWHAMARHGSPALAALAPLAVAWLLLMALAPLSILLLWQEMRHHHAGLALAWLLALAGAGLGSEALAASRARRRPAPLRLPLLLPLLLVLAFPHWARESARGVVELDRGHARAAAWLAAHGRQRTVLLTDAGLLAIAHDGPAIDALGLGSPDLTEAALNGPGALVESLARRRPLPEIAAVEPGLIKLPRLLGEPLLPGPAPAGDFTVLARVRRELLVGTALEGPGHDSAAGAAPGSTAGAAPGSTAGAAAGSAAGSILEAALDFAYLPDERRHRLLWQPPPLPPHSSVALLLPGPEPQGAGALALQGCRPLFGRLGVSLPAGAATVRLCAAVLAPAPLGEVAAAAGDERGPTGAPLASARLAADRWSDTRVTLPAAGASFLWLARRGPGVPCLESLRFSIRAGVHR